MNFFRNGKVSEGLEEITKLLILNKDGNKAFDKLVSLYESRGGELYKLRDNIEMPLPPEGIVYKALGTMEHNICDVIAQRMKGRKMSWSINKDAGEKMKYLWSSSKLI